MKAGTDTDAMGRGAAVVDGRDTVAVVSGYGVAAQSRPTAVLHTLFAGGLTVLGDTGNLSGIRKHRIPDAVEIGIEGVMGDDIFDRRFHGGPDRALNIFAQEVYAHLQAVFPAPEEPWQAGGFGENFSTLGLLDAEVRIGDVYRTGGVIWQVSQPRSPCWKLNARFGIDRLSRHVQEERLTGWYARVLQPGRVQAGEPIELLERDRDACTIAGFWNLIMSRSPDPDQLEALGRSKPLAGEWQTKLQKRAQWLRRQAGRA
ncbi:MAG: MOSC domain-containing protein [Lautropia sp.]|nr:MOSC domain-containing protein [Lautropia sp.]